MKSFYSVTDINISKLLHDDKEAYVKEGHGGKPVWEWPIYHFFQLYNSGNKVEASKQFADWYLDQYRKYGNVKSSEGGMKGGSLDRMFKQMKNSSDLEALFEETINKRVEQRFCLLNNIKQQGYVTDNDNPIKAYKKDNKVILFAGHHRVAALAALNLESVPDVYIYKNRISYKVFKAFKKIKLI